jgi:hypothetical protein
MLLLLYFTVVQNPLSPELSYDVLAKLRIGMLVVVVVFMGNYTYYFRRDWKWDEGSY